VLLQSLVIAGIDTTATTMTWALCLLLNNREALKKAQKELDLHVGRKRQVKESDIKNLVYLQAILKETMRLYPPAGPLSIRRESSEDCTLAGYHIPVGTQLLVNLSKIHRDPHVWSDPNEFQPERFLTSHKGVDVRGQHFELLPFGSGRRMCPGISLALQVIQLTLATLLHAFEIATPSDEPVDMTEKIGFTNMKATPLEVHFTPRLPTQVYALFA
jgi:cytochrome P450